MVSLENPWFLYAGFYSTCRHFAKSCTFLMIDSGHEFLHFSRVLSNWFKVTSTLAGVLQEKIRTRDSFNETLTNYISEESLLNGVYNRNIAYAIFPFSKCGEQVRVSLYWIHRVSEDATEQNHDECTKLFTHSRSSHQRSPREFEKVKIPFRSGIGSWSAVSATRRWPRTVRALKTPFINSLFRRIFFFLPKTPKDSREGGE